MASPSRGGGLPSSGVLSAQILILCFTFCYMDLLLELVPLRPKQYDSLTKKFRWPLVSGGCILSRFLVCLQKCVDGVFVHSSQYPWSAGVPDEMQAGLVQSWRCS